MDPIDIEKLRVGFRGKPFYQLIENHLNRQTQDNRIQGIHETIAVLPREIQNLTEGLIDSWNIKAYDKNFWSMDTSDIFDMIVTDVKKLLSDRGLRFDDEMLFNIFNIVVLNYAYSAYDQPKMREFMGIKENGFPWLSAISLLYLVGVIIYISRQTPTNLPMIIGYGLANLGYLMFGAGILKGTFKIFGLKRRFHVFVVAVIAILTGIFLSNLEVVNHLVQR